MRTPEIYTAEGCTLPVPPGSYPAFVTVADTAHRKSVSEEGE
ncbi:hypothetical protein [Myceligenerans indicum]|nr:hypothetical protein [Myceligenerans indicum]